MEDRYDRQEILTTCSLSAPSTMPLRGVSEDTEILEAVSFAAR